MSQTKLRELGWAFDLTDLAGGGEGRLVRVKDEAPASEETLPCMSDEYVSVRSAVDSFLVEHLLSMWPFCEKRLPAAGSGVSTKATVPIFHSDDAFTKENLLILIMGKGESLAPAWVSSACIYAGLRVGSMFSYIDEALRRDYGVLILNPNVSAVLVNDCEDEQDGPAPPSLCSAIAELGFSENSAHLGCLGARSLELEDVGNWIFARIDREDVLTRELTADERRTRVRNVPLNETPPAHVQHVWDSLVQPCSARCVHFAVTSYGGFGVARLLDSRAVEVLPRLGAIAMADSSHFIDCQGKVSDTTAQTLRTRSRNWITSETALDTCLDVERLHSPCVSAGTTEHAEVPGRIVDSAFRLIDSLREL